MKSYTTTVNGNVYDVTGEEKTAGFTPAQSPAPAPAPAAPHAPAQPAPAASSAGPSGAGKIAVKAGAAGEVFKIEASVGQSVQPGDPVVIIEAMKMEIPVVAPEAGTVASIDVAVGGGIEAGGVVGSFQKIWGRGVGKMDIIIINFGTRM